MDVDYDEIIRILELFQASDFAYLSIKIGNVTVTAAQKGIDAASFENSQSSTVTKAADPASGEAITATDLMADPPGGAEVSVSVPDSTSIDGATVDAPMVGTFYAAPSPEAPPYVTVGQAVKPGETLALIEAMKMFTAVEAPFAGTVVEVVAENGSFVEFGQPLFLLHQTST